MYYNFPQNREYMINEKLTFKSLRETASYFECDKKTIASKINTNKQYKTYTFKTI